MKDKCTILLSTYNGEKYIEEQLISILNQDAESFDIYLYIRDDGSSDRTKLIIKEYMKKNQNIELVEGENIGVQKSFMYLINSAPKSNYYAFCDQDDIWNENKLSVAISNLANLSVPALFYSGYSVVDENLRLIRNITPLLNESTHSITQILFQNQIPGCTMVFNNELEMIIKQIKIENIRMHDSFVCAIAFAYGKVISSSERLILYRQHSSNTLGYGKKRKLTNRIKDKCRIIKYGEPYKTDEICDAIMKYNPPLIDEKTRNDMNTIIHYRANIKDYLKLLFTKETGSRAIAATLSIKARIFLRKA